MRGEVVEMQQSYDLDSMLHLGLQLSQPQLLPKSLVVKQLHCQRIGLA